MATMKVKIITDIRQKRKRGTLSYTAVGVPNVQKGAYLIMKSCRVYSALVPCGHACFCKRCAVRVAEVGARCPVCRTKITMVMRLFK